MHLDECSARLGRTSGCFVSEPAYMLGNGNGVSVRDTAVVEADRHAGDPVTLIADSTRAKLELCWQPPYAVLVTIIEHAWQREQVLVSE